MRFFLQASWSSLPTEGYWQKEELIPSKKFWSVLTKTLRSQGHDVFLQTKVVMDGNIEEHVKNLETLVNANGGLGPDCVFIGQSVGQMLILRYLASRPADQKVVIGGAVCIAAWLILPKYPTQTFLGVGGITPWLKPFTSEEIDRIRSISPKLLAFTSTDDRLASSGFGSSCAECCGLGLAPGAQEAAWRKTFPWVDMIIESDRGHYMVDSLNELEMSKIMALVK